MAGAAYIFTPISAKENLLVLSHIREGDKLELNGSLSISSRWLQGVSRALAPYKGREKDIQIISNYIFEFLEATYANIDQQERTTQESLRALVEPSYNGLKCLAHTYLAQLEAKRTTEEEDFGAINRLMDCLDLYKRKGIRVDADGDYINLNARILECRQKFLESKLWVEVDYRYLPKVQKD